MNTHIIFDIETGPLPESVLLPLLPKFDPADVKTGNLKDPAKIAEKIAQAEASHKENFIANAALSPLTGQVLAVGWTQPDWQSEIVWQDEKNNEQDIIEKFWKAIGPVNGRYPFLVGFNSHRFDLPFLIRRSWALGIPFPGHLRQGRYWSNCSIDLREVWQLGDYQATGSLDAICRSLGCGQKNGDGALFYKTFKEDREKALDYLRNDLDMTTKLWKRLCPQY